ncbi:hypothetical protein INR49_012689 [Caranx melampygus]|nr:hypothetical protein INR49_012689 [Caranx melampygus]
MAPAATRVAQGCSGGGVNAVTLAWTLTEAPPKNLQTTTLALHATRLLLETRELERGGCRLHESDFMPVSKPKPFEQRKKSVKGEDCAFLSSNWRTSSLMEAHWTCSVDDVLESILVERLSEEAADSCV